MNKILWALAGSSLLGIGGYALAAGNPTGGPMMGSPGMGGPGMNCMKGMDANGDGQISQEEFMSFHQQMWSNMPKNGNGMVDMKSMPMMPGGCMGPPVGNEDAPKTDP